MDPSNLPPSVQAFMSLADLSGDDQYLDIELSTDVQGLDHYKPYIFRLSLTPIIDTTAHTVQADVYYSTNQLRDEEHVALLTGSLLNRPNHNFYLDADEINPELGALASLFFNTNGNVSRIRNTQLTDIASRPGGFLWLYNVEVKPPHRGIDLALQLVTQTFNFLRDKWTLAVMQPEPLGLHAAQWPPNVPADDHPSQSLAELNLRRHFSRLGFVQAGPDASTACAMYLVADVFFPSKGNVLKWKSKEDARKIEFAAPEKHDPKGLDKQLCDFLLFQCSPSLVNPHPFPLRPPEMEIIAQLLSGGASVHESRALFIAAKQGADASLFQLLVSHGGQVNAADESGNRPLHEAAREISPSIPHLIKLGAYRNVMNVSNETPFDLLEVAARSEQASVNAFEDCKPKPSKHGMRNLRRAMMALMPGELKSQLVDGCLAPRLHELLLLTSLHAGMAVRNITADIFRNEEHLPLAELGGYVLFLDYLPADLLTRNKEKIGTDFLNGWEHVFSAIGMCLHRNKVPTVGKVRQILESYNTTGDDGICDVFFEAGGKIEYGIDAVICECAQASRQDPDHWMFDVCRDDVDKLACTRLDDLFNVVKAICFQGCAAPPYGPYESSIEVIFEDF